MALWPWSLTEASKGRASWALSLSAALSEGLSRGSGCSLPPAVDQLSEASSGLPPDVHMLDEPQDLTALPADVFALEDRQAMPSAAKRTRTSLNNHLQDGMRIRDAMQRPCNCSPPCSSHFTASEVQGFRQGLARLSKPDQDMLLFELARQASSSSSCKGQWKFLGRRVCKLAMFWLTGCSRRLKAMRSSVLQGAPLPPLDLRQGRHDKPMTDDVLEFLRWMYQSVGETLPDVPLADVDLPACEEPEADAILQHYSGDLVGQRSFPETRPLQVAEGEANVRHLQPGTWYELWLLYKADRENHGRKAAAFSTFWLAWKSNFSHMLVHRRKNSYGKCNICVKYKAVLKMAYTAEARRWWCEQFSLHLLSQYRDRAVYYHNRELSHLTMQGKLVGPETTCCLIVDAMDQAKFACPRHLPGAKQLQDCQRPRLHVVGAIMHGVGKFGFFVDPTVPKDSSLFIEVTIQCLHVMFMECRRRGCSPPSRFVLHSDNAGDCKNVWTLSMNALLTGSHFRVCFNQYLRTGHSHEDIDAMFGSWARHLAEQSTLETPTQFMASLTKAFEDTRFVKLDHVRDWGNFFSNCLVDIHGMGGSEMAAHSYTWITRADLDVTRYGEPQNPFKMVGSKNDVVLLVRKYLHVEELSQPPLVVLPEGRASKLTLRSPSGFVQRLAYSPQQQKELRKTARLVSQFPFNLHLAAKYLIDLAEGVLDGFEPHLETPSVDFLEPLQGLEKGLVAWTAPANSVEPPASARLIQVTQRRKPRVMKRRHGKGKNRPQPQAPHEGSGEQPPPMWPGEGAPHFPQVGLYGDLVLVEAS